MFAFSDTASKSKCRFSQFTPPLESTGKDTKSREQFKSTFATRPFAHTLDVILPEESYQLIQGKLEGACGALHYSRVHLSLGDVLSGDFFNQYIKQGDILLLSEGRPSVDNVFSLKDGTLRLELDRPTYERCGLVGRAIPDGGRKHDKSRYEILLNLREPSMVQGKKRFERLTWACKNVLTDTLTWLFYDLRDTDPMEAPINRFHPQDKLIQPTRKRLANVSVPSFRPAAGPVDPLYAEEVYEWLSLVALESPRINSEDPIDPYLCRYAVTDLDPSGTPAETVGRDSIVKLRWRGFIPTQFAAELWGLSNAIQDGWMAINASCFGGKGYTALRVGDGAWYSWVCI